MKYILPLTLFISMILLTVPGFCQIEAEIKANGAATFLSVEFGDGTIQSTAANSFWSESSNGINFNTGNVGIGTTNASHTFHIVHETTTSNTVSIEAGMPPAARDVLEIKVDQATDDEAQFLELERGSTIVAQINTDGSASFKDIEFGDETVQTTAAIGPIAFGTICPTTTIHNGTGNFAVVFDNSLDRYEINITSINYDFKNYTTLVTPIDSKVRSFYTESASGNLIVTLVDKAEDNIPGCFSFIVFD